MHSKLARCCRECCFKDICNNKKLEAYSVLYSEPIRAEIRQPMIRNDFAVGIYVGDGRGLQVDKERLDKSIREYIESNLRLGIQVRNGR